MPRLPEAQPIGHLLAAILGGLAFVASLIYFGVSYAGRYGLAIDSTAAGSPVGPLVIDAALFSVFALHHSIFARTPVKTWIGRHVPPDLERSTYVWLASLLFIGVCAAWQPIGGTIWRLGGLLRDLGWAAQIAAGAATLVAARQLGVFRLAGITQVREAGQLSPPVLDESGLYGHVRHPIYTAWVVLVWAAPTMTATRAAFAALSSIYLVAAVPFEERDLHRLFGPAYAAYCRRVRWRMLPFVY